MTTIGERATAARLHQNESPYGAAAAIVEATAAAIARVSRYPDADRRLVTEALAARWDVTCEQVAVGSGIDELVLLSALATGRRSLPGLITEGTFNGYRKTLAATGRGFRAVPLCGTRVDDAGITASLPACGIAYVCNPHNPTGHHLDRAAMDAIVSAAARTGVPVLFDEAYMEFAPPGTPQFSDYVGTDAPVAALHTFSKIYGLAGLRIGYVVGNTELVAEIKKVQNIMPFSVNVVAQAAALAALDDPALVARVRQDNEVRRDWFCAGLRAAGMTFIPSVTNFVALPVAKPSELVDALREQHAILTMDTAKFGLPGHVRVSLGARGDLQRLLDALTAGVH